jgi:hypothetical protein
MPARPANLYLPLRNNQEKEVAVLSVVRPVSARYGSAFDGGCSARNGLPLRQGGELSFLIRLSTNDMMLKGEVVMNAGVD